MRAQLILCWLLIFFSYFSHNLGCQYCWCFFFIIGTHSLKSISQAEHIRSQTDSQVQIENAMSDKFESLWWVTQRYTCVISRPPTMLLTMFITADVVGLQTLKQNFKSPKQFLISKYLSSLFAKFFDDFEKNTKDGYRYWSISFFHTGITWICKYLEIFWYW